MRITRNDIVTIAKKPYKLVEEEIDEVDYQKWKDFIECHKTPHAGASLWLVAQN